MTTEIILVLSVLAITVLLFVFEIFRVDIIAILILLGLAWLGLVPAKEAFSGFASNAVISMIAVMILGYGIDRSGAMNYATRYIMRIAGSSEKRLIAVIATTVGFLSAFMQNIGAAVLFLPALLKISRTNQISPSRLMMPLGFSAILGGTMSMVGSGPLIILNDLLLQGDQAKYGLFSVTPLGVLLLASGVFYFLVFGRFVLPAKSVADTSKGVQQELIDTWRLPSSIFYCRIPKDSAIINKTREDVQFRSLYNLHILSLIEGEDILYAPWRYSRFVEGQILVLLGDRLDVEKLVADYHLLFPIESKKLAKFQFNQTCGFAEIIIPPLSPFAGKSIRDIAVRKTFGVEPILLMRGTEEYREDFSDQVLQPGDAIILFGPWDNLKTLGDNRTCVLVTPIEADRTRQNKPVTALLCFLGAIALAISGFHLAVALMTGALAMILLKVLSIDEAYRAIEWQTVFLLAGLIPLGIAMERTGTAAFIAQQLMSWLHGSHTILLLLAVAILATLFSLFMSNVAATVLLVPLVMMMGTMSGVNPRALALLVAVCASNSFLLPTHQVNALLMSPGGYRNIDYLKAGGLMTIIFIVIVTSGIYLIYL
ncbi:SLC13 family permease [candidate division KSB1 bacterium]|nr:SLC13 family permease [candidate division KSB1 bacterium]RQW00603.1 MAG: SLC13 family permease [candidate division KSB1 bacterium]